MLETLRLKNRKPFAVAERVAKTVRSDPLAVSMAHECGSSARTDAQRAGEMVGVGLFFLELTADSLFDGRTRRFFRAMTPESGERAAVWLTHCLGRRFPEGPTRPVLDDAYSVLCSNYPLADTDESALEEITNHGYDEIGFDRRRIDPELSSYAVEIVLPGHRPHFPSFEAGDEFSDTLLGNLKLGQLWGVGGRLYYRLVDPGGYERWAAQRGIADPFQSAQ